jgi:hypothetical protein
VTSHNDTTNKDLLAEVRQICLHDSLELERKLRVQAEEKRKAR